MMHFFHRWTQWSGIETYEMIYYSGIVQQKFQERRQSRTCKKCSKIQECAIKVF